MRRTISKLDCAHPESVSRDLREPTGPVIKCQFLKKLKGKKISQHVIALLRRPIKLLNKKKNPGDYYFGIIGGKGFCNPSEPMIFKHILAEESFV